jgi:hypothetical protein
VTGKSGAAKSMASQGKMLAIKPVCGRSQDERLLLRLQPE